MREYCIKLTFCGLNGIFLRTNLNFGGEEDLDKEKRLVDMHNRAYRRNRIELKIN